MLSIVAFVVALLVFVVLFFSGGEGKKFGRAFLRDEAGGVGNRFAYGNVSNGLIARIIASLGFVSPFGIATPASWAQPTWFVDPQNVTGTASDSNSGIDAAHAVRTYNGGIVAKWGTNAPTLRQNTTINWLSDQIDASDPVLFLPHMVNAVAVIQAPLDAAHRLHTGVIPAVTVKNRVTAQLLAFDLGFAAPIGSLVHNITKNSFAWVYRNAGGTVFDLSQPMHSSAPVVDIGGQSSTTGPLAEDNTWTAGDAFEVFTLIAVDLVQLAPVVVQFEAAPIIFPAQVQVYHITFLSPGGAGLNDVYVGNDVDTLECNVQSVFVNDAISDDLNIWYINTYFGGGAFAAAGANPLTIMAAGVVTNDAGIPSLLNWGFDYDAIIDATLLVTQAHKLVGPIVNAGLGSFYIAGHVVFFGPWLFSPADQSPSREALVWGPGLLDTGGFARISYKTATAVATFLQTGGMHLNGQATARTISVAGVWSAAIAITPANLDDAAQLHGLAWNPGGSSYTNQGTS